MKTIKKSVALLLALVIAFSCFAVAAVAAPKITDVTIIREPDKKVYFKGRDWDYGYWKPSEGVELGKFVSSTKYFAFMYNGGYYSKFTDLGMVDMNGLVVKVTYSDGTTENVTYKETKSGVEVKQNIYFSFEKPIKVGVNTVDVYFTSNTAASDTYTITLSNDAALKGDVNEDLKVNSADALLVLQHVVGSKTLAGTWLQTADLNADKKINSADALAILKIAVNKA